MKKLILSVFLAIACCVASAQKIEPKKATFDDFMPMLVNNGYNSFPFDISNLNDGKYKLTFAIREYENNEMVSGNVMPWQPSFNNMLMLSQFSEEDRAAIKAEDMYDAKRGIYEFYDQINIGLMPEDNDSTKRVMMSVKEAGSGYWSLKLKPLTNKSTGKQFYAYNTRLFSINEHIVFNEFIPLVLVGSSWYDEKAKVYRFCGEKEIAPDLSSRIIENIPHFYVIGVTITPSNKD